jgi:hypothetical protein
VRVLKDKLEHLCPTQISEGRMQDHAVPTYHVHAVFLASIISSNFVLVVNADRQTMEDSQITVEDTASRYK